MIINGRDVGFRRSVRATADIAEICPGKDLNRINEMIQGKDATTAKTLTLFAAIAAVLSDAYERHKAKEDPAYKPNPLTIDEIMDLEETEFNNVVLSAFAVFEADGKHQVSARPAPGKKKARSKSTETLPGTDTKA